MNYRNLTTQNLIADVLCVIGLLFFAITALYRLDLPGVYYDEAIFAPVTLKLIENCQLDAAVSHAIGCFPLMQQPPYVGALKAILYAPVFWLFGVSPATIRLPMLFISGLVLLLTFRFIKQRFGPLPAAAALILMATDPVYIFHSRIDWGPFVLANLFKLLAVGFCLEWLENGRARYLALTLLTLLLGFYDKLNFLWMIIALSTAILVVYPERVWRWFKENRRIALRLIIPFIVIAIFMVVKLVLPAMALNIGGATPFDLAAQIAKIRQLYKGTFSGEGQFSWMFNQPLGIATWTPYLIWPQLVFGTVLSFTLIFRPSAPFSPARLLAFVNTLLLVLIAQLIATREVGGSHHLVMLWPFHYLHLILCGLVILSWLQVKLEALRLKRIGSLIAVLVIMLIVVQHVKVTAVYAAALDPKGRFSPRFDPVIYKLVETLKEMPADLIISVDWGIHQTALSLAPSRQRPSYRDWWPLFMQPPGVDAKRDAWLRETYLTNKQVIFVTHLPEVATFNDAVTNFEHYLTYWHLCPVERKTIANEKGKPFYLILRVDTRSHDCPIAVK